MYLEVCWYFVCFFKKNTLNFEFTSIFFLLYCNAHLSEKENCRAGTWFYPLVFDWMEADLNASCKLEVNKKKFVGLSRLID